MPDSIFARIRLDLDIGLHGQIWRNVITVWT